MSWSGARNRRSAVLGRNRHDRNRWSYGGLLRIGRIEFRRDQIGDGIVTGVELGA